MVAFMKVMVMATQVIHKQEIGLGVEASVQMMRVTVYRVLSEDQHHLGTSYFYYGLFPIYGVCHLKGGVRKKIAFQKGQLLRIAKGSFSAENESIIPKNCTFRQLQM